MKPLFNRQKDKGKRQQLRNSIPDAENLVWQRIKNKQLNGLKFRRQYGIGPYVIDFFCPLIKLAIEIDGGPHFVETQKAYDSRRQNYIENYGIKVIRFRNDDVYGNLEEVIAKIVMCCDELKLYGFNR